MVIGEDLAPLVEDEAGAGALRGIHLEEPSLAKTVLVMLTVASLAVL